MMKSDSEQRTAGKESDLQKVMLVNIAEKRELGYWARAIRIPEEELMELVKRVGPSLQAILREVTLKDIRDREFEAGGK
ncbi:MAG: DUF3606 domain-containing protein [Candidatus Aminicenantes bacterium]|nr:DUF3606 domain-containing protein [Candidatus Aminicenantes bacterium]